VLLGVSTGSVAQEEDEADATTLPQINTTSGVARSGGVIELSDTAITANTGVGLLADSSSAIHLSCAEILDGLAREQFRRLRRAQSYARHVGARLARSSARSGWRMRTSSSRACLAAIKLSWASAA
jgi:hypothetical protein